MNNGEISGYFGNGQYVGQYLAVVDGSTFTNNGVMNVSGWYQWGIPVNGVDNYAIALVNGGSAFNNGIINTGTLATATSGTVSAVTMDSASSLFQNEASGVIYVGREAQHQVSGATSTTDVTSAADTAITNPQYGIRLYSGIAQNLGTITLGSLSQNAVAMAAINDGTSSSQLINSGTISMTGAVSSTNQNVGMLADNSGATVVGNSAAGSILISADGNIGMKANGATSSSTAGTAINDGVIKTTSASNVTGMYASLDGTVTNSGTIDLTSGTDNIGIYALGDATANSSGTINTTGWALKADGSTTGTSTFNITGGTVKGSDGALYATNNADTVINVSNASLSGKITTDTGSTSAVTLNTSALWNMTGDSTVTTLTNGGNVDFSGSSSLARSLVTTYKTLTVNGDYVGNNGSLTMNTSLGGDASSTDKLVVTGNTSGATSVTVKNTDGVGGLTTNGIELISVGGTSAGTFTLASRVAVGAYEYTLNQGTTASTANNWYLTSVTTANPDGTYRPEIGTYINNLAMANSMFNLRLHDRIGQTNYVDALTGEQKVTSMWLRQVGGHSEFRSGQGQLQSKNNRAFTQLGGDITQWSTNGTNRFNIGLMAGYGYSRGTTTSAVNTQSRGTAEGYSAGIYGTWYADNATKTGLYVDVWSMFNHLKNDVKGDDFADDKYDSHGVVSSIETGYAFHLGDRLVDGKSVSYYMQPTLQVTHMGVKADDHEDKQGNWVQSVGNNNIQTRVGLRWYSQRLDAIAKGTGSDADMFFEVNWLHNNKQFGVKYGDDLVLEDSAKNIGEVKIGMTKMMSKNFNIWTNIAQQFGQNGFKDTQAVIGVKYSY